MELISEQIKDMLINRHIINVLMDSPFYLTLPVSERKEIIDRIFGYILQPESA
jgi:hypothetical protein